jgi:hypothetical protein
VKNGVFMRTIAYVMLAVAAILAGMGSARAASISVLTDSGNLGEFSFSNTGIISGTATIAVSVPSLISTVNTVNGAIVPPEPVRVNTPFSFTVTPTGGGQYSLTLPAGITKTVGATVGSQAILGINLTQGDTPAALPNFFNASGPVTSLLANLNPLYDFAAFSNGLGKVNFTFTATTFTATSSFAGLFSTVGATAIGNGSFSQSAAVVPEAASVVMLGLGLGLVGVVAQYQSRHRPWHP